VIEQDRVLAVEFQFHDWYGAGAAGTMHLIVLQCARIGLRKAQMNKMLRIIVMIYANNESIAVFHVLPLYNVLDVYTIHP
jgi:hypothetical protein